jgi:hypothetical protein
MMLHETDGLFKGGAKQHHNTLESNDLPVGMTMKRKLVPTCLITLNYNIEAHLQVCLLPISIMLTEAFFPIQ